MPLTNQWKFNGNLEDSIGNKDFADINSLATYTNGVVQQCLNFPNGPLIPNSGIYTFNPLPSTPNSPWSIAFWIKNVEEDVFLTLVDGGLPRLYFSRSTEKNSFTINFLDGTYSGQALIKLGTNAYKTQFTHFAFVYRASNLIPKFYINGVEQIGTNIDFIQAFTTNFISRSTNLLYLSNNNFGYQIEDLRVYNEAINDTEIAKIYNAACSEITTETNLYISTQPTGQYQNVRFTNAVVQIRNSSNQVVTSSNIEVFAQVYSGGGTLLGTTSVQAVNGIATFDDLRIDQAGTFTIRFYVSCSNVTSVISNNITLTSYVGSIALDIPDLTLFISGSGENNSIDLFITAFARAAQLTTLYTESITSKVMPLFTKSSYFSNDSIDLFMDGRLNEGITLFMEGRPKRPNSIDLFLGANFSEKIPLFIASYVEDGTTLYTSSMLEGKTDLIVLNQPQNYMPLFLQQIILPSLNSSKTLFIRSILLGDPDPIPFFDYLNLYIQSSSGDQIPLYMPVDDVAYKNGSMPLFTKNFIQKFKNVKSLNMYILNTVLGKNASRRLFIKGSGSSFGFKPFNNSSPLYIERDIEYFAAHKNLFVHGRTDFNDSLDLIIKGANLYGDGINLVVPIVANVFSDGADLYTHGFTEE